MKLFASVLLTVSVFVMTHGAAIDNGEVEDPSRKLFVPVSFFASAWDYHRKLETLQSDINNQLTGVRTSVSTVLKAASSKALERTETNANNILDLDRPVRHILFKELNTSQCVNTLRELINRITEFTGFSTSNCIATYENSVQEVVSAAYEILQQYEGPSVDTQLIVIRSFVGYNAFRNAAEIEALFSSRYHQRLNEWNEMKPHIEVYISELSDAIDGFGRGLLKCFENIQAGVAPEYVELENDVQVCKDFDNTIL